MPVTLSLERKTRKVREASPKCEICGKTFKKFLDRHMKTHEIERPSVFKCDICGKRRERAQWTSLISTVVSRQRAPKDQSLDGSHANSQSPERKGSGERQREFAVRQEAVSLPSVRQSVQLAEQPRGARAAPLGENDELLQGLREGVPEEHGSDAAHEVRRFASQSDEFNPLDWTQEAHGGEAVRLQRLQPRLRAI